MSSKQTLGALTRRFGASPWPPIALTVLVWGANVVVARGVTNDISPFALVTLRWVVVCAIMMIFARRSAVDALRQLRPHWAFVAPMGAVGFTASNLLFFAGAHYTTGLNIAIVSAVIPVLVLIGASLTFGTRIGAKRLAGVALTIVGILVVATRGDLSSVGALQFNIGDLLEFAGAITYAAFTVALRKKPPMTAFAFFIGIAISAAAISLPGLAIEWAVGATIWPGLRGWMAIIYVAVFTSLIGQVCWIRAVEILGPSRAGVFQNLVPIVGATMSVLVLGEAFQWYHALSMALVLGGIWIAERLGR